MQTLQDKIDAAIKSVLKDVQDSDGDFMVQELHNLEPSLRAAFRDVVEQVVEEMIGEEDESGSVCNYYCDKEKCFDKGFNWRIKAEKATGENIIKSLN